MIELADEQDANAVSAKGIAEQDGVAKRAAVARPHLVPRDFGRPKVFVADGDSAAGTAEIQADTAAAQSTETQETEESYADYYTSSETGKVEQDSDAEDLYGYY